MARKWRRLGGIGKAWVCWRPEGPLKVAVRGRTGVGAVLVILAVEGKFAVLGNWGPPEGCSRWCVWNAEPRYSRFPKTHSKFGRGRRDNRKGKGAMEEVRRIYRGQTVLFLLQQPVCEQRVFR